MKNYRLITVGLIFLFLAGGVFQYLRRLTSDEREKVSTARENLFPQATSFSNRSKTPLHYKAFKRSAHTAEETLIGLAFLTTDITPDVRGYAGPIKILVGMDLSGTISGVEMISHSETPSYVTTLADFMQQFPSLNVNSPLRIGKDLDGISRATITGEAIANSIREGSQIIASQILGLEIAASPQEKKTLPLKPIIITFILFAVAICGIILNKDYLRWTALVGGLIYFGLIQSTMVSVVQLANIGLGKLPLFIDNPLWYTLLGLTLLTLLFLGNVYCGCLCPFATLQETLYKMFKNFRPKKIILPQKLDKKARSGKFIVLFTVLGLSFAIGKADPANMEAFVLLFTFNASTMGWTLIIFMLCASVFYYRFWCKYLCPIGAFNGLLARYSLFKIDLDEDCGGCEACSKLCPTEAIQMDARPRPVIDFCECILCGKCIEKCPKGSLHFKGFKNEISR